MAGTLGKLDGGNGGNGGSLRMELMQGLVKMTWGGSSREEPGTSSRGFTPVLSQGASALGDKSGRPGKSFFTLCDSLSNLCELAWEILSAS